MLKSLKISQVLRFKQNPRGAARLRLCRVSGERNPINQRGAISMTFNSVIGICKMCKKPICKNDEYFKIDENYDGKQVKFICEKCKDEILNIREEQAS